MRFTDFLNLKFLLHNTRLSGLLSASIFITLIHAPAFSQETSVKGNWTQSDRDDAEESLQASRTQFVNYLGSANTETLISCLLDEMENTYENFSAVEPNSDEVQIITQRCLEQIRKSGVKIKPEGNPESKKGEWHSADLRALVTELEKLRPELEKSVPSDKIDQLLVCIGIKAQNHFQNFAIALSDTSSTMPGFLYTCMEELGVFDGQVDPFETENKKVVAPDPNSSKGDWSVDDITALKVELNEMRPDLEASIGNEKTDLVFSCILTKFEESFENYADINNHPELYKSILNECYKGLNQ